jgi:voltage-gated potassium channel
MKGAFSKFCFDVVENQCEHWFGRLLERFLAFLILGNVVAVGLQTVSSLQQYNDLFFQFEVFSIIIFVIEYIIRIWTAPYKKDYEEDMGRVRYMFSAFMVFDFVVILPSLLALLGINFLDTRMLRIIRVFRIFRLQKYSQSLRQIFRIFDVHKDILLSAFIIAIMGILILSTLMFYAENSVQPEKFSSIPATMYWAMVTLSTIGYGDITPMTEIGKFLTMITAVLGVALYSLPTAILGAAFYAEAQSKEAKKIVALQKKIDQLQNKLNQYKQEGREKVTPVSWKNILPFGRR